jgi:hypothetical protein
MNIRNIYKISGYLSLVTGVLAAISISRGYWIKYGIMLSIAGFVLAGVNIFLNMKYFSDEEKWPKGYLGMFLNSLPVIFLMLIIFKFKK